MFRESCGSFESNPALSSIFEARRKHTDKIILHAVVPLQFQESEEEGESPGREAEVAGFDTLMMPGGRARPAPPRDW
jgi:hypothetical protein